MVSPINSATVHKPCSSTDLAEKFLQRVKVCLTMCRGQSLLTKTTEKWTKCRVLQKKRLLRKKFKQHFLSALQKNKPTFTSGSVLAERIEKAKNTKFVLELINFVYCFLDGYGKYESNIVCFKKKLYNKQFLFATVSNSKEFSQRMQNASRKLDSESHKFKSCHILKTKFLQRVRF